MKTCICCGESKPFTDFYRHPQMADGYLGKCKVCHRAGVKKNRLEKADKYREYDRNRAMLEHRVNGRERYAKTDAGRAAIQRAHLSSNKRYPERRAARVALGNAVRDGRVIPPQACWYCGSTCGVHGHHPDYSNQLGVSWMCQTCHKQVHQIADDILSGCFTTQLQPT